jgi:hypothetical protein
MSQIYPKPDGECLGDIIASAVNDLDSPRPLTEPMIREVVGEAVREAYSLGKNSES